MNRRKGKLDNFSFDNLLQPYVHGGTKNQPVGRSMGTILDYLINKKKYEPAVVGEALIKVFMFLYAGNSFKGDGTYGSPGRELVTTIRIECDRLTQLALETKAYATMHQNTFYELARWVARETRRRRRPWFIRMFTKKKLINLKDL